MDSFDFSLFAPKAAYFYLRFLDGIGRKTWGFPVHTGRELPSQEIPELEPISKKGVIATDTVSGEDASSLISDDPLTFYTSAEKTCSILLDLNDEHEVCALGHYPKLFFENPKQLRRDGIDPAALCAQFPYEYRLYAGNDKETLSLVAEGVFRVFGGEEFILFPERTSRFLRLDVLSTIGAFSKVKAYENERVTIGELTPFKKK